MSGDDTVKRSGRDGFCGSMLIFCILATLFISRLMLDMFMVQRFCLAWRAWLTDRLTGDWLDGKAYYRARFIDDKIDNPDQRIQNDIDIFTANNGPLPNVPTYYSKNTLLFGAVDAVVSMISFTAILWNLSGPLTMPIIGYELPRAMFWIGIVFVLFASVIAFWIGRPIIWLSFNNEKYNAAFRYALVRLRDASEAVAFYRGEVAERTGLRKLFAPVVSNYKRYVNRSIGFNGWNWSMGQAIVPLPYLLQFPRFYSGEITLGAMHPVRVGLRPDPGRAVVLPQLLRLVRRLPGRDHPARGSGHRQRGGQGAAGDHDHAVRRRHGSARRHRGPHARREATHQPARHAPGSRRHHWWSPARRAAARPRCCAAWRSCGRSRPAR